MAATAFADGKADGKVDGKADGRAEGKADGRATAVCTTAEVAVTTAGVAGACLHSLHLDLTLLWMHISEPPQSLHCDFCLP